MGRAMDNQPIKAVSDGSNGLGRMPDDRESRTAFMLLGGLVRIQWF